MPSIWPSGSLLAIFSAKAICSGVRSVIRADIGVKTGARLTKTSECLNSNITIRVDNYSKNLQALQRQYYLGAAMIAPLAPFLLLQGQITRWKVGHLPDAAGERQ